MRIVAGRTLHAALVREEYEQMTVLEARIFDYATLGVIRTDDPVLRETLRDALEKNAPRSYAAIIAMLDKEAECISH